MSPGPPVSVYILVTIETIIIATPVPAILSATKGEKGAFSLITIYGSLREQTPLKKQSREKSPALASYIYGGGPGNG